ncbi:kinase-like domain-containing protein [Xylaria sp. FL1777]|nr:kinase-like domain-containing protein [Xylaria sp. FL1777]
MAPLYFKKFGSSDENYTRLDDDITSPWTELELPEDKREGQSAKGGQFSVVRKIKIHPDNRNFGGEDDHFALKIIKQTPSSFLSEQIFLREIRANRRLGSPHERIVPLLTAFKRKEASYLVFPWAGGGSLRQLWERTTPPDEPDRSFPEWCSVDWLWQQSLGIAEGVAYMHGLGPHTPGQIRPTAQIHGDIKPENILSFPTIVDSVYSFELKLADFGVSQKVDADGQVQTWKLVHTLTYRPPEKDLEKEMASLRWDSWCLGAVYLEFITWFLLGYHGVERFQRARENDTGALAGSQTLGRHYEDTFFTKEVTDPLLRAPSIEVRKVAKVKKSVTSHIKLLKSLAKCNDRLRTFLAYIERHLLVVDDDKRATAEDVRCFLRD